jgi:hypothetical protein|tara:strand:- start:1720 stop:2058 length:339 start_codon:yes stop_codon:yes gene_type:complete
VEEERLMARHKRISGARSGGLTKWFNEKWVDISRPKKGGGFATCGRRKAGKGGYPKCVPASKARSMTAAQRKSAVRRKRAVKQGVGGKPTNVKTFAKRGRKKKTTRRTRRRR